MLIQALTEHFNDYFERDSRHNTILWFDPKGDYINLLDHLSEVELWRCGDSLLNLRYRLIHRAPEDQTVVYLPKRPDQVEVLRPFFATSLIFRDRLYKFLSRQDIDFPDDPEVAHQLRRLLPRLATRSIGKGHDFWKYNLANLERARATLLGGNFEDALLKFLAHPKAMLKEWQQEQLDGLFFAQLESNYDLSATPEENPDKVALQLTAQLVLVRAYMDTNQPSDFPYISQLPDTLYFERCQIFLDRWHRDITYKSAYVRLADDREVHYNLAQWAKQLPLPESLSMGATFANVEAALWDEVKKEIAELERELDWRTWLEKYKQLFKAREDGFWAREKRATGWELLVRAANLLKVIHETRELLDHVSTPATALRNYSRHWWRVDYDFRRLREMLDSQPESYDQLRDRCSRSYSDILRQMNDRFANLLEMEQSWPPQDMSLPAQDRFWSDVMTGRETGERVAVMYVDALRYELGEELTQHLEEKSAGENREISARLATTPTITPIGMSALLPSGHHRQVDYDDGWQITIEESDSLTRLEPRNLSIKDNRKAWLKQHFPNIQFYNLDEFLEITSDHIPETETTIIFDTTLDAVGETASKIAWNVFSGLLQAVEKGIHKLLSLGVNQIHVVTDHGFLLLDDVGEHEKVSVRDASALATKSRYVVGKHLGHTDQLRFPVPGSTNLEAWYPRGIGCFRTPGPYNYVHGGLSLQELVVPHLKITQRVIGRPIDIRVELPDIIHNAQFKITLEPVAADMFDQSRQVTLTLEKEGKAIVPPLSHVVKPTEAIIVDFLLPMGCGLEPGDQVQWTLRDAITDEVLVKQEAVGQVDLW